MKKAIILNIKKDIFRKGLTKILEDKYIVKTKNQEKADLIISSGKINDKSLSKVIYVREKEDIIISKSYSQITYDITEDELLKCIDENMQGLIYIEKSLESKINRELEIEILYRELSSRDKTLIEKIVEEKTNIEIGRELYLSEKTVKNCLTVLYRRLELKNRDEIKKTFKNLLTRDLNDVNIYKSQEWMSCNSKNLI